MPLIKSLRQNTFISRGDESGTHSKEKSIWKAAGLEPAGDWYVSSGQGMGEVLTMTNEQQAYTLSDRATYLARDKECLDLVILVEGDEALFNPYGVSAVDPAKNPLISDGCGAVPAGGRGSAMEGPRSGCEVCQIARAEQ